MKLDCGALNRCDALGHAQARLGQWRTASRRQARPARLGGRRLAPLVELDVELCARVGFEVVVDAGNDRDSTTGRSDNPPRRLIDEEHRPGKHDEFGPRGRDVCSRERGRHRVEAEGGCAAPSDRCRGDSRPVAALAAGVCHGWLSGP